ncbi:MAG: bifunctional adenosylcobinamide kinase/adenosylcobinamide-phosphate guanylyltransferase [Paracoccaceae bacterium]|jgi:adenosylcobinamide kinase/adenosylcobinamide-phosphate guanylyltransferase
MPDTNTYPHLALILGGASSGKSAFAERLATSACRPRAYIATSQPFDDEMEVKIAKHQRDRGPDWQTMEAPLDLGAALAELSYNSVVLIDCMTLWLSNQMQAEADIEIEVDSLLTTLSKSPNPVVCVSNELGMGLVPNTSLGRRFRDLQGILNKRLAEQADLVVFVTAGLPLVLKGGLPEGLA